MSRVHLNIEANSAEELILTVRELLISLEAAQGVQVANAPVSTPVLMEGDRPAAAGIGDAVTGSGVVGAKSAPSPVDPPPAAEPKKARGRGAKKDQAAAAPAAQAAAQTPPAQDLSGMFDDPPAQADPVRTVTREDLRAIGNEHMAKLGMDATLKIVKEYGVEKISGVPEAKWPEIYGKFEKGLRGAA